MLPSWLMSTEQILQALILEREKLNRAIETLAEPVTGRSRFAHNLLPAAPAKGNRRSATQKQAQSERMKAYWAKRRKASSQPK
jgi:hypothetical protein